MVAHVMLLQVAHDAGGGVQAEGGAAGEDEGIEGIGVGQGREQAGLPRGGAAAADVNAAGVGAVEQDDGDTGHGLLVLGVAEADALDVRDGDMVHRDNSFDLDVFLMIPHFSRHRKPLLSGGKSGMIEIRIRGGVCR